MSTASAEATVTVTRHERNGAWIVALQGEHDLASAPLLEQRTSNIWPRCGVVIIDLSEAAFISSSVIRWLMRVECELGAQGAHALGIVEGAQDSFVARTLGLFGVRDLFACYATQEDALARSPAEAERMPQRSPAVPG